MISILLLLRVISGGNDFKFTATPESNKHSVSPPLQCNAKHLPGQISDARRLCKVIGALEYETPYLGLLDPTNFRAFLPLIVWRVQSHSHLPLGSYHLHTCPLTQPVQGAEFNLCTLPGLQYAQPVSASAPIDPARQQAQQARLFHPLNQHFAIISNRHDRVLALAVKSPTPTRAPTNMPLNPHRRNPPPERPRIDDALVHRNLQIHGRGPYLRAYMANNHPPTLPPPPSPSPRHPSPLSAAPRLNKHIFRTLAIS